MHIQPLEKYATAAQFADHLAAKMDAVLHKIEASDVYRSVADPGVDAKYLATVVKYVLLEVFAYGPHVTEATFTAIGRLPKDRPDLMKTMVLHDVEEADHGEMALKDFVKLGGNEAWARARRITPESFAMGATCRLLAASENPFSYLGYMYLFEGLTPILTERAQQWMTAKGFPTNARHFVDFHAKEDIGHVNLLRKLIEKVVNEYPDAASAIEYGFDCFAAVYPLPIWVKAVAHAKTEMNGEPVL